MLNYLLSNPGSRGGYDCKHQTNRDQLWVYANPLILATKVRYFGVKSTNGCRAQMGTKPAKVTHRPSWPTKAAKPAYIQLYPVSSKVSSVSSDSWI